MSASSSAERCCASFTAVTNALPFRRRGPFNLDKSNPMKLVRVFILLIKFVSSSIVVYEGGDVCAQARSLWRLELARTKWAGGFIMWNHPMRIRHITTGRYLGVNDNNDLCLLSRYQMLFSFHGTFESIRLIRTGKKPIWESARFI